MTSSYFFFKLLPRKHKRRNIIIEMGTRTPKENIVTAMSSKCRVCFKNGFIPIFGSDTSPDVSEEVMMFGGIEISKNDQFPKLLCDSCFSRLQGAIFIRKSAKKFDSLLRKGTVKSEGTPVETELNDRPSVVEYELTVVNYPDSPNSCYKCKVCKLSFPSNAELLVHKNSKQHKSIRIQCPVCLGLLTAHLYKKHMARHQSSSHLICDVCGKLYRKHNLLRHLQLHSFDLPYSCKMCPYRGRSMESLKIHMRTHTGEKPFSCDQCNSRFLTRSNLNRHLLTHSKDRPFKCKECSRGFYTQRDVDSHFKSDHAGIKEFGCRTCGNIYGTRKALMRHELRVHKRSKMSKGRMPLYLQAEYNKI